MCIRDSHTDKEKVRFLKDEYGIGGRSHALSGATHSGEDHDGKGLHYKKQDCPDVHLNWENVAKRITSLVQDVYKRQLLYRGAGAGRSYRIRGAHGG